ncbi:MAG: MarR family transcriptional regulator [Tepidisphaera sp.]|nr:MarR family transcriptional regulator [Tepidisphaera sp.]
MLNLMRTGAMLAGDFAALFKSRGLSEAAYNTLRVLRGAGDTGRPCHEIGEHLVARVPDVTRMVDRLEAAGLVTRERSARDRRVVNVRLTPKGLQVVTELDAPVVQLHQRQLGHLTRAELVELNRLLVKARRPESR